MKKYIILVLAVIFVVGCDGNDMCSVNEDCINMCKTYDNNSIFYACEAGNCKCVDESKLKCSPEDSLERCESICAKYRPGTTASCVSNKCTCLEPDETEQEN